MNISQIESTVHRVRIARFLGNHTESLRCRCISHQSTYGRKDQMHRPRSKWSVPTEQAAHLTHHINPLPCTLPQDVIFQSRRRKRLHYYHLSCRLQWPVRGSARRAYHAFGPKRNAPLPNIDRMNAIAVYGSAKIVCSRFSLRSLGLVQNHDRTFSSCFCCRRQGFKARFRIMK